jgi:hypothetical protein
MAGRNETDDCPDRDTHSPHTGLAAHHFRVSRNSVEHSDTLNSSYSAIFIPLRRIVARLEPAGPAAVNLQRRELRLGAPGVDLG